MHVISLQPLRSPQPLYYLESNSISQKTPLVDGMSRKESEKKKKQKKVGVEAILEPGVGALYIRGTWMKKLKDLDERKRKNKVAEK
jgi:hypothetical protein